MITSKKRIGNIEVRHIQNEHTEIICWYQNPYYGHQSEYKKVESDGRVYYIHPELECAKISEGCFLNSESCYVVAFVEDCRDDEPDIRSVGSRPFRLSEDDRKDFLEIINYIFEEYHNQDEY